MLLLHARRRSKAMTSSRRRWEDGDEAYQAGGAGGLPGCAGQRWSPEEGKRGRDEHDSGRHEGRGADEAASGNGGHGRHPCVRPWRRARGERQGRDEAREELGWLSSLSL